MIRFKYLTPRVRLTPRDLNGTAFDRPKTLHFVCSPARALAIVSEVKEVEGWSPITIYEPIPVGQYVGGNRKCSHGIPGQLCFRGTAFPDRSPSFNIHPEVTVCDSCSHPEFTDENYSPNAEEVLGLLSMALPVTQAKVEEAASTFLDYGVGNSGQGLVVIRSGALGAYAASRAAKGRWVEAFWGPNDLHRVVDVTGTCEPRLQALWH